MAMRLVLLGLVASLGFDPPSGVDVESWSRAGRDWVDARMADLSSLGAGSDESGCLIEPLASQKDDVASTRVDLAFEAVVEGMASGFSIDLAATRTESTLRAVVIQPGPATVVDLSPETDLPTSRLERVSTAVRLTRQAMDAWAALIQPSTEKTSEGVRGDSL